MELGVKMSKIECRIANTKEELTFEATLVALVWQSSLIFN